jgi:hypothetical protein
MTLFEFFITWMGMTFSVWVGMRVERWLNKKHYKRDMEAAYSRGFKAGQKFVDRVKDEQLNMESSIRILTGEDS